MNDLKYEASYNLIPVIIIIASMVNAISMVSIIFWAIGIATTFTALNKKGIGVNMMNDNKRKIILGIGMTITICSLIDEVSIVALVFFGIGYVLSIAAVEKTNQEKSNH